MGDDEDMAEIERLERERDALIEPIRERLAEIDAAIRRARTRIRVRRHRDRP